MSNTLLSLTLRLPGNQRLPKVLVYTEIHGLQLMICHCWPSQESERSDEEESDCFEIRAFVNFLFSHFVMFTDLNF